MSTLKDTLHTDLTAAIRARDSIRVGTLRMALAAITNEEVSGTAARELTNDDVIRVLTKEAKKRREAVTAYTAAQRPELAAAEEAELAILSAYLPAALGDTELRELVTRVIADVGATGIPQLGLVMKTLQPLVAGRADGAAVAALVRAQLASG
ncbi:MAG: GatB/YqeY domain-containing protein [Dermatophilaceae bacterium]|jgi:uncharacterized protein YqeY|nr:GatB/YqeY domain-containing protein [Actinomycetales bacterium]MBP8881685.1 GatB/YqeY domain-containing protein [Dermatophilaceae bacterium]MBP9917963.1 GatB/YqeY domain-containing protein [Dermatophilaceae bacterium]